MRISGIIWLEDILDKLERKHAVKKEEVKQVLAGSPRFRFVEKGHRRGEDVYSAMGQTEAGRYLVIFFVLKRDNRALILSARDMTRPERKRYGKK
ncbi:MAG TPA: BrnT family toxin [Blastocatellia bacterium]|nr:BrnT family toxin [Blastocatellia bacterium]